MAKSGNPTLLIDAQFAAVGKKTAGHGGKAWNLHDDRWSVWRPELAAAIRTGTQVKVAQLKAELANRYAGAIIRARRSISLLKPTLVDSHRIDLAWHGLRRIGLPDDTNIYSEVDYRALYGNYSHG